MIVKIIFDDKSIGLFGYTEDSEGYIHLAKVIDMNPYYVYGLSIKCFHKDEINFYNNPYIIHNPRFHIVEYEFSYLPKNITNKKVLFVPLGPDCADYDLISKQIADELMLVVHILRNLAMIDRRMNISVLDPNQFRMNFKDPIISGLLKRMANQLVSSND